MSKKLEKARRQAASKQCKRGGGGDRYPLRSVSLSRCARLAAMLSRPLGASLRDAACGASLWAAGCGAHVIWPCGAAIFA
jgi:hypothetical protein